MSRWEYKFIFVELYDGFSLSELNAAGLDGWEAVGTSESKGSVSILLKREVSQ
jgi:hypothetical protein